MFLFGCMGIRFGVTYLAWRMPLEYLPVLAVPALMVAGGFTVIYVMGWRKTGPEVRGDRIWWDSLRPVHAALWFLFAVLAFARMEGTWVVLLMDTLIGLSAFSLYHLAHLVWIRK